MVGSVSVTVNGGMRQTPEGVIVPLQETGVGPSCSPEAVPVAPLASIVVSRTANTDVRVTRVVKETRDTCIAIIPVGLHAHRLGQGC
jgi:hypothetical protein